MQPWTGRLFCFYVPFRAVFFTILDFFAYNSDFLAILRTSARHKQNYENSDFFTHNSEFTSHNHDFTSCSIKYIKVKKKVNCDFLAQNSDVFSQNCENLKLRISQFWVYMSYFWQVFFFGNSCFIFCNSDFFSIVSSYDLSLLSCRLLINLVKHYGLIALQQG